MKIKIIKILFIISPLLFTGCVLGIIKFHYKAHNKNSLKNTEVGILHRPRFSNACICEIDGWPVSSWKYCPSFTTYDVEFLPGLHAIRVSYYHHIGNAVSYSNPIYLHFDIEAGKEYKLVENNFENHVKYSIEEIKK